MDESGSSTALAFNLSRHSPFFFKCQVCKACCYNKAIQMGPFEALCLARRFGLTTTEFLHRYTEPGTAVLQNKPDGSCVFLGPSGCGVHPDRPLVCRLFPLGQITGPRGEERYARMPLHPDCLGFFDTDGTVESYLESQGTGPYFTFDKKYSALKNRILDCLPQEIRKICSQDNRAWPDTESGLPARLLADWLDIDAAVAASCGEKEIKKAMNPAALAGLHMRALEALLDSL
jgi:Fe-S-cluster containining protein